MKPVQGEPWPVGRAVHAACCLNYGQDHPQLLVYGGLGKGFKILGDMWTLVDTGKWTEVSLVLLSTVSVRVINRRNKEIRDE